MQLARLLLAVLLPPVGVLLTVGATTQFWLNVLLTILGYIPGVIHAFYIVLTRGGTTQGRAPLD